MKLFGGSKNGNRVNKNNNGNNKKVGKKKRTWLRVLISIFAILLTLAAVVFALYKFGVKPPPMKPKPSPTGNTANPEQSASVPPYTEGERTDVKYTFLILGTDQAGGGTDTIMVATFDVTNYTLNVVSIPRDTLVNVSWDVKKVNSLYAYEEEEGVVEAFKDILGFEVDFYIVVNLAAFEKLVDAVDGIYYDVPIPMYYDDPYQDLVIAIDEGPQWLDGADALGVVRFRRDYDNGDIGRIDTQQDFLKVAATQIIEKGDLKIIPTIIDIFLNNLKTDLTNGHLLWLAKEFYKINPQNIHFEMLPGNYDLWVYGGSYVGIYVDEWLKLLNEKINPFDKDIKLEELNILTEASDGSIYSTSGVYRGNPSWGNDGYSSSWSDDDPPEESSSDDEPSESPTDDPTESPTDDSTESPPDTESPPPSYDDELEEDYDDWEDDE